MQGHRLLLACTVGQIPVARPRPKPLVVPYDRLDEILSAAWELVSRGEREDVYNQEPYCESRKTLIAGWGSRGRKLNLKEIAFT